MQDAGRSAKRLSAEFLCCSLSLPAQDMDRLYRVVCVVGAYMQHTVIVSKPLCESLPA